MKYSINPEGKYLIKAHYMCQKLIHIYQLNHTAIRNVTFVLFSIILPTQFQH